MKVIDMPVAPFSQVDPWQRQDIGQGIIQYTLTADSTCFIRTTYSESEFKYDVFIGDSYMLSGNDLAECKRYVEHHLEV